LYQLEFHELNSGFPIDDKEFVTEPIEVPEFYKDYLDKLVLVKKLRQIVTITGFTRIAPWEGPNGSVKLASVSGGPPVWLPATQNRGEGIFFSIRESVINDWMEKNSKVEERLNVLTSNSSQQLTRHADESPVSARYLFLHSLSHMLMRGFAEFAGYSVSSLQERIYSNVGMAGILLFTSSPSSDGSLGGLVDQGTTKKFSSVLQKSIERSKICSSDPLCAFYKPGRTSRKNGAACHACLLIPEPSCENMNEFLDRSMVHSTLEDRFGFFGRN